MLKVIVTTYPPNTYLLQNFDILLKRFWGVDYEVDIAKEKEKLSDQLKRIVDNLEDEYFILIKEDFYLLDYIDKDFLEKCIQYAIDNKADRFSLQHIHDGYSNVHEVAKPTIHGKIDNTNIYKLSHREEYLCSFEASIWRKDFLKEHLFLGGSDRDIEINMSRQVKRKCDIFVPEKKVLIYRDALIGGQPRIKFIDNELWLLEPTGWENKHITL